MPPSRFSDPLSAPSPRERLEPLNERLGNLERGLGRIHGAIAEDLANLSEDLEQRTARIEHKLQQVSKLQSEHHFVLQEALQQAPAANRHLGDLLRSLGERIAMEHHTLHEARNAAAAELGHLSVSAAELRQLVNDVLPATHEASDKALKNLARLADEIEHERQDFEATIRKALQEQQDTQRWLVMVSVVGGGLVSALVTLGLVVGLRYVGWLS